MDELSPPPPIRYTAIHYGDDVRAYKFLDAAGRAPFTGVEWPVGEWLEADEAAPCRAGVHACRAGDVAYWITNSMWHIEIEGDIVDSVHKVVGRRGRLLAPVDGADAALNELREVSVWRSRDRAVAALRADGDNALADDFAAAASLEALAALGNRCDDSNFAGRAAALAADTAAFAVEGNHSQAPFVAACSAGHVAGGSAGDQERYDAGYTAERTFQSEFLIQRLSLT
jgi:hypothetical protein